MAVKRNENSDIRQTSLLSTRPVRPIRVVVAVGRHLWLESIVALLRGQGGIEPVDAVRDFARLKVAVSQHLPETVVLALPMHDLEDPTELLDLRRSQPDLAYAFLVDSDSQACFLHPLLASAPTAFIASDLRGSDLAIALQALRLDFTVVCRRLIPSLLSKSRNAIRANIETPDLTDRQRLVLQAAAEGASDVAIGARLGLSARTVQTYLNQAREKLQAVDRTHAVALALSLGVITPPISNGVPTEFSIL